MPHELDLSPERLQSLALAARQRPVIGACTARESAEGGPLVAGLPYSSHEILARVRRTAA